MKANNIWRHYKAAATPSSTSSYKSNPKP